MELYVGALAKISNLSIKSLRYYEKIALLKPKRITEKGYKIYGTNEVYLLQQVVFLKKLGFKLSEIKAILSSSNFEIVASLKKQKNLFYSKIKEFEKIIDTINLTLRTMDRSENFEELFENLGDKKQEEYKKEAKSRWGNTEEWKQSEEKLKNYSKADLKRIEIEGKLILKDLADLMENKKLDPKDEKVQILVNAYCLHIGNFYDCTKEIYSSLADMYVADERFRSYFEEIKPGLAEFFSKAIKIFCGKFD